MQDSHMRSGSPGLEAKRAGVIAELIQTERQYVQDLGIVLELFVNPIRDRGLLPKEIVASLFSNIHALLPVNIAVLEALEKNTDNVGAIFLENVSNFRVYSIYVSAHVHTRGKLATYVKQYPLLKHHLDACALYQRCRNLLLPDFLIMPLQRLCVYPSLLENLLRATPGTHPDAECLRQAATMMKDVLTMANERTGKLENLNKLKDIQDSIINGKSLNLLKADRKFVREGAVTVVGTGKKPNVPAYLFLFNDMLLITSPVILKKSPSTSLPSGPTILNDPNYTVNHIQSRQYAFVRKVDLISGGGGGDDKDMFRLLSVLPWEDTSGLLTSSSSAGGGARCHLVFSNQEDTVMETLMFKDEDERSLWLSLLETTSLAQMSAVRRSAQIDKPPTNGTSSSAFISSSPSRPETEGLSLPPKMSDMKGSESVPSKRPVVSSKNKTLWALATLRKTRIGTGEDDDTTSESLSAEWTQAAVPSHLRSQTVAPLPAPPVLSYAGGSTTVISPVGSSNIGVTRTPPLVVQEDDLPPVAPVPLRTRRQHELDLSFSGLTPLRPNSPTPATPSPSRDSRSQSVSIDIATKDRQRHQSITISAGTSPFGARPISGVPTASRSASVDEGTSPLLAAGVDVDAQLRELANAGLLSDTTMMESSGGCGNVKHRDLELQVSLLSEQVQEERRVKLLLKSRLKAALMRELQMKHMINSIIREGRVPAGMSEIA